MHIMHACVQYCSAPSHACWVESVDPPSDLRSYGAVPARLCDLFMLDVQLFCSREVTKATVYREADATVWFRIWWIYKREGTGYALNSCRIRASQRTCICVHHHQLPCNTRACTCMHPPCSTAMHVASPQPLRTRSTSMNDKFHAQLST